MELMVASSIVGIITLGTIQLTQDTYKTYNDAESNNNLIEHLSIIDAVLSDKNLCSYNLSQLGGNPNYDPAASVKAPGTPAITLQSQHSSPSIALPNGMNVAASYQFPDSSSLPLGQSTLSRVTFIQNGAGNSLRPDLPNSRVSVANVETSTAWAATDQLYGQGTGSVYRISAIYLSRNTSLNGTALPDEPTKKYTYEGENYQYWKNVLVSVVFTRRLGQGMAFTQPDYVFNKQISLLTRNVSGSLQVVECGSGILDENERLCDLLGGTMINVASQARCSGIKIRNAHDIEDRDFSDDLLDETGAPASPYFLNSGTALTAKNLRSNTGLIIGDAKYFDTQFGSDPTILTNASGFIANDGVAAFSTGFLSDAKISATSDMSIAKDARFGNELLPVPDTFTINTPGSVMLNGALNTFNANVSISSTGSTNIGNEGADTLNVNVNGALFQNTTTMTKNLTAIDRITKSVISSTTFLANTQTIINGTTNMNNDTTIKGILNVGHTFNVAKNMNNSSDLTTQGNVIVNGGVAYMDGSPVATRPWVLKLLTGNSGNTGTAVQILHHIFTGTAPRGINDFGGMETDIRNNVLEVLRVAGPKCTGGINFAIGIDGVTGAPICRDSSTTAACSCAGIHSAIVAYDFTGGCICGDVCKATTLHYLSTGIDSSTWIWHYNHTPMSVCVP